MRPIRLVPLLVLAAACSKGDAAPKTPIGGAPAAAAASGPSTGAAPVANPLPAEARVPLDEANALFRQHQYAEALAKYRAAVALAPKHPAPWYGVYMAAQQLKNQPLADSALAAVKAGATDAPEMADSGLAKLHEKAGSMAQPHPAFGSHPPINGHPPVSGTTPAPAPAKPGAKKI